MSKERILITGAAGFLGSNAVRFYADRGDSQVVASISPNASVETANQLASLIGQDNVVRLDLANSTELGCNYFDVDLILHFAGLDGNASYKQRESEKIYTINSKINVNVFEMAREFQPTILIVSSSDIYESTEGEITEETPLAHIDNGYKQSKIELEELPHKFDLQKVVIVRPGNIYGPQDAIQDPRRSRFIATAVANALTGQPIIIWGDGSHKRSFLYIDDFLNIVEKLIAKKSFLDPLNVAGANNLTTREVAEHISSLVSHKIDILYNTEGKSESRIFNTAKLQAKIGEFQEVSINEGLTRTIADIRARLDVK